jgi:hypothetical protein
MGSIRPVVSKPLKRRTANVLSSLAVTAETRAASPAAYAVLMVESGDVQPAPSLQMNGWSRIELDLGGTRICLKECDFTTVIKERMVRACPENETTEDSENRRTATATRESWQPYTKPSHRQALGDAVSGTTYAGHLSAGIAVKRHGRLPWHLIKPRGVVNGRQISIAIGSSRPSAGWYPLIAPRGLSGSIRIHMQGLRTAYWEEARWLCGTWA